MAGRAVPHLMPHLHAARERVAAAFQAYYKHGLEAASPTFRARHDLIAEHGVSERDVAHLELGGMIAVASNTGPAAFWILYHVFADAALLAELRAELDAFVTTDAPADDGSSQQTRRTFDFSTAKQRCSLLTCIFQETLRRHSTGTAVRSVEQDTLLAGRYLLKQGAVLQMPSAAIHSDPAVWGADMHEFRPRRWEGKPQPGSFRGFGGGTSLCPGRHFAMNEILIMVCLMVLRYDVRPAGSGAWQDMVQVDRNMTTAVGGPKEACPVDVLPRAGFEDVEWRFELSDSKGRFDLSAVA